MNEWWKRTREQLRGLWTRWSRTQKIILFSIIGAGILALVLLFSFSATPAMVPLISSPVKDADARLQIAAKLDELQVKYQLRPDNVFYVADEQTARRVRVVLNQENLIPKGTDPWALFDMERWTTTDFERDVNLQRAVTKQLEQHIMSLDDVDNVSVTLVVPKTELFAADQLPADAMDLKLLVDRVDVEEQDKCKQASYGETDVQFAEFGSAIFPKHREAEGENPQGEQQRHHNGERPQHPFAALDAAHPGLDRRVGGHFHSQYILVSAKCWAGQYLG